MPPSIAPPTPAELALLMGEHAHRYPEQATVDVIGDGGALLRLPLLIGNPTGTAKSPTGADPFPAWANLCALTLGARKGGGVTSEIVRDCLIFPGRGLLVQWQERWAAILDPLGPLVLKKFGADAAAVRTPEAGEKPPEAIAAQLAATPAALWRWITVGAEPLAVVIKPPSKPHWDGLTAALGRENVDCVALLDELVSICVKGEGFAARLQQWPGIALPLENVIVKMAGAAAEARLGEW